MRQTTLSLVILSFMLGFIAPACGFMWGGQFSVVVICTDRGIEQRIVANSENPTQPDHKTATDECEFCFQNMNMGSYLITSYDITHLHFDLKTRINFTHQNKVTDNFPTIHLARGPPALI